MHAHIDSKMRKIGLGDDVTVDGLRVAVLLWPEPEQRVLQWRAAAELAKAGAVVSVAPPSWRNLKPEAAAFSKAVPLAEALGWPLRVEPVETVNDLLHILPKSVSCETSMLQAISSSTAAAWRCSTLALTISAAPV